MESNRNSMILNDFSFKDIKIGMKFSFERLIDKKLVEDFSKISRDSNPLHMDQKYASATVFGGRIAHGMLLGSFFSALVGMLCPGKRSLYVSQSLRFKNPLLIGNLVKVCGKVIDKSSAAQIITMETLVTDENKKIIVDGEAIVKIL